MLSAANVFAQRYACSFEVCCFSLLNFSVWMQTKILMGEVMKEASFSLAEAKFTTGDFNHIVLHNVTKAQIKVRSRKENVAGVNLPVFEHYQDGSDGG